MRRSLGRAALALATAASATVLPASLASAKTTAPLPDCPARSLCAWSGTNFTGQVTTFRPGEGCVDTPFPIRSAANTFSGGGVGIPVALLVMSGKGCTGEDLVNLQRGQSQPSLPTDGLSVWSVW
ncbi:peptidase inhibitor family I36 protein [Actinomadura sp. KC06]|uniref:peptidase inhibitor family I36 protein n=1 Tax=Actinomadura sp. KC06 TaxID=2530369 RepID=UPI001404839D|nr:peptidase inhibitor family I36 protein [Actinomadura sp. KC06]